MAKVQNIPGVFGDQFDPTALAKALGIQNFPFQQQTNKFINMTDAEVAKSLGYQVGTNRSLTDPTIVSAIKKARSQTTTPPIGSIPAFGAAQRLGKESIFDQLGILDFAKRMTQPQGYGRTSEQDALLQELIGITGGVTAARGLGAPTAGALASQIAPQLAEFRQQNITNQLAQLQGLVGAGGLGVTENLGNIQALLDLAGLAMPQPIVTQKSSSGGGLGSLLGGLGTLAQGGAALIAACHVAEELFGTYDIRTHFARFYCSTHDNDFVRLYRKMSKVWAKHLKDNPEKKAIVQPIWEKMAYLGYKRYLKWQDGLHQ